MSDRTRFHGILARLLIVAVPTLTFATSANQNRFVNWDDAIQLYGNRDFNPPTVASVASYWRKPHFELYIPLTYTLWGAVAAVAQTPPDSLGIRLNPLYFHWVNLLLHIAAALVVYSILRRFIPGVWPACAGALLFAIHPIQVEAVCWVSGMYTVLSGFLTLMAVYLYIRFVQTPRRRWFYAAATLLFALALLAKPSSLVAVPIAAVIDLMLVRRSWKSMAATLIPWVIISIPICIILGRTLKPNIVANQPIWLRCVIAADTLGFYLWKILYPVHFVLDYGRSPVFLKDHPGQIAIALVAIAVFVLACFLRRKAPWIMVGSLLFLAGTFPFVGLTRFDFQHFSTIADRYAYLGMLGPAFIAAAALASIKPRARSFAITVTLILLIVLAVRSFVQATVWYDTRTLFEHNLELNSTSLAANNSLGYLDIDGGRMDLAAEHFRTALKTDPEDAGANEGLAHVLLATGNIDDAIGYLQTLARLHPDDPRGHSVLGEAYSKAQRYDQAVAELKTALECCDRDTEPDRDVRFNVHTALSQIYELTSRPDAAANEKGEAAKFSP